jgi:hypothetical protein
MYLGTKVNIRNDISEEIKTRNVAASTSCFGLQKHLKSRILSRTIKIQLYRTLIKPTVMYGSECWTLPIWWTKLDEFERKVLRRIYGPIQGGDIWRSRYNSGLYAWYKEPKLTTAIRIARLWWVGHVQRTEGEQKPNRLLYERKRTVGEGMWEDQEQDGCTKLT